MTSYGDAPEDLLEYDGRDTPHGVIRVHEGVDATDLASKYSDIKFDAIVWIGPTNDEDLSNTSQLVEHFVLSAGEVLRPGGVVFVIQDMLTPNFRGIMSLRGALYCCQLQLKGRTQTQHSKKRKMFDNRVDHLIAFRFRFIAGRALLLPGSQNTDQFVTILTSIMSNRSSMWSEIKKSKKANPEDTRLDKKGIARLIFKYADNE